MTYYLDIIYNFLQDQGYTNIFIDYDPGTAPERIFIQNTGGTQIDRPNYYRDFSLYVRRNSRQTARQVCETLQELLANRDLTNGTDTINKIEITQPSMFFAVDSNTGKQTEFVFSARCLVVDKNLNRIT
jgi:hypothetical protein